jgi:hypothetical protein
VAVTGDDGSFAAGTRQAGDGALAGRYRVTVVWRSPTGDDDQAPNLLPPGYARPESSGLEIQAVPGSDEPVVLRLTGPTNRKRRS